MVNYGPTSLAREYFIDLGYQPANRKMIPDFLLAVTDSNVCITLAFGIVFLALIITEFGSKLAEVRSVLTFKYGTAQTQTSGPRSDDVETAVCPRVSFMRSP